MPGTGSIPFEGTHLLPLTVLSNGHRGVNVFFVITGFVSASSGLTDSMRRAAHSSPREFLVEAASSVRRRLSKVRPDEVRKAGGAKGGRSEATTLYSIAK
jgi:hypothetical protein